jgi:hypothetical protein
MQILKIFILENWGTIADWVMIGVTAITAYFLYKTLKSQNDVQKTQNDLYRIESIRFRESIKPVLKYSGAVDMMKLEDTDKKILTIEVTNETNSLALKISRVVKQSDKPNQIFIPMGLSDKCDHLINGDKPLLYHFLIDNPMNNWVIFSLSYQDVAGTKYKQAVLCICDSYGIDINSFMPEIIEDFDKCKFESPRKPQKPAANIT